jgi:phosphoribosyl 1,2-cyclic phosphodiesterase
MSAEKMVVRCRGVRGSHPVPGPATARHGGNTPCVEVTTSAGGRLVLDAGTGIIGLGESLDASRPIDLLLSHLHWDHLQGLPFFRPLYSGARVRVWSSRPEDEVEAAVQLQLSEPYFPVSLAALPGKLEIHRLDGTNEIDGVRVATVPLHHPGDATGFRLEWAGRVMVYASDHEIGQRAIDRHLIEASRGASLLIGDAQYDRVTCAERRGWGHSAWEDMIDLARDAEVERLALFHHDPNASDDALDALQQAAKERWAGAEVAVEGIELSL